MSPVLSRQSTHQPSETSDTAGWTLQEELLCSEYSAYIGGWITDHRAQASSQAPGHHKRLLPDQTKTRLTLTKMDDRTRQNTHQSYLINYRFLARQCDIVGRMEQRVCFITEHSQCSHVPRARACRVCSSPVSVNSWSQRKSYRVYTGCTGVQCSVQGRCQMALYVRSTCTLYTPCQYTGLTGATKSAKAGDCIFDVKH